MKRWWVVAGVLAGGSVVAGAEPTNATVRGERVNVRARPHPQAEVVGQLSEPAVVQVRGISNDWVEIVPPAEFDLWVHREFVEQGTVNASKLVVRAGPGINYPKVGELKRGDTVQVRGEFGDWLKIAPPPGSSLWIAKSLVRFPEPPKPAPAVVARTESPPSGAGAPAVPADRPAAVPAASPPLASSPSGSTPVASRPPPPPVPPPAVAVPPPPPVAPQYVPTDLRLAPVDNQGAVVQREGRVRATMLTLGRPSRYQLVDETGGAAETSCYLRGNDAQLQSFLERRLRIRGRQYWVQGSRYPVVVVDQISVLPD
ncbi:MAG: SH3 domain-containing protein [Kiritimatiellae bacterium]|nr:SH3 domain-containing protein [Kiritimatiellia bacterium]